MINRIFLSLGLNPTDFPIISYIYILIPPLMYLLLVTIIIKSIISRLVPKTSPNRFFSFTRLRPYIALAVNPFPLIVALSRINIVKPDTLVFIPDLNLTMSYRNYLTIYNILPFHNSISVHHTPGTLVKIHGKLWTCNRFLDIHRDERFKLASRWQTIDTDLVESLFKF